MSKKTVLNAILLTPVIAGIGLAGGVTPAHADSPNKGKVINPLSPESYRFSSPYGPRCMPVVNGSTMHQGQDMGASDGSTIRAIADGVVTMIRDPRGGSSGYLGIRHVIDGEVIYSGYYHMWKASAFVKEGQRVKQGQKIAVVGSSGPSTAPHLHFEIWKKGFYSNGGYQVNPIAYMSSKGVDLKKDAYLVYKIANPTSCTYYSTTNQTLMSAPTYNSTKVASVTVNQSLSSKAGDQSGNWVRVSVKGKTGWLNRNSVSPSKVWQPSTKPPVVPVAPTVNVTKGVKYTTTATTLNLRNSASTTGAIVGSIPRNAVVTTLGKKSGTWLQVKYGKQAGWASTSHLKQVPAKPASKPVPAPSRPVSVKYVTKQSLNLRVAASASSSTLAVMPKNVSLTGTGKKSGSWVQVKYGKKQGWAHTSYLTQVKAPTKAPVVAKTVKTTSNLHMRAGASAGQKVILTLKKGTTITLTGKSSSGWVQVKVGGKIGWVSKSFVK